MAQGSSQSRRVDRHAAARAAAVVAAALLPALLAIPCRGDTILSFTAQPGAEPRFQIDHIPTLRPFEHGPLTGDPVGIAAPADGTVVYILDTEGRAKAIETAQFSHLQIHDLGTGGGGFGELAVRPDGARLYGLRPAANEIVVYDPAAESIVTTIPIGASGTDMAVAPDGGRLYVAHRDLNSVTVIDTATDTVVDSIAVSPAPVVLTVLPDGSRLYVGTRLGEVSVVDLSTNLVVATIFSHGLRSRAIAPSADGSTVYIADLAGHVVPIDTATDTRLPSINSNTKRNVIGLSSSPDPNRIYASTTEGLYGIDTQTHALAERLRTVPESDHLLTIAVPVCGGGRPPCDDSPLCAPQVAPGCQPVQRGLFSVQQGSTGRGRNQYRARFLHGPALAQTDFGNPLVPGGSAYALCIYNEDGNLVLGSDVDRAGDSCFFGEQPCWKPTGGEPPSGKGYSYKEFHTLAGAHDAVLRLRMGGGAAGRSKVLIKAGLAIPSVIALALAGHGGATMQFVSSDGLCLTHALDTVKRHTPWHFKAK